MEIGKVKLNRYICDMKICGTCKIEKFYNEFGFDKRSKDGYRYQWKTCKNTESRIYRIKNTKPKKTSYQFELRTIICQECNIEKTGNFSHMKKFCSKTCQNKSKNSRTNIIESKQKYVLNNSDIVKLSKKNYIKNNPEKVKISRNKEYSKMTTKIKSTLRTRVRKVLKGLSNGESTVKLLGCSSEEFIKYIELKFIDGMSWDNWSFYGWHLDHIIPLSKAKTKEDMYKLCHYTNFQPLWWEDNLKKSDKISEEWGNETTSNRSI